MQPIFREKGVQCLFIAALFVILVIGYQINTNLSNKQQLVEIERIEEAIIQNRLAEAESAWVKGKEKRKEALMEYAALQADPFGHPQARSFWDFFYPSFDCPHLVERIGRLGDGGKWVCGFNLLRLKKKPCFVYSFGIANETTFEEQILQETNCTICMYDFLTFASPVRLVKLYPDRAFFYQLGLGAYVEPNFTTLKNEMERNGHEFIDILKIDIEGGEFDVLRQINASFPTGFPFAQFLVEVHLNKPFYIPQNGLISAFNEWWEMLVGPGLRPFRNEVNFFEPLMVFEFSFINTAVDNILLHARKWIP